MQLRPVLKGEACEDESIISWGLDLARKNTTVEMTPQLRAEGTMINKG